MNVILQLILETYSASNKFSTLCMFFKEILIITWSGIAQSVQRLATGWTVRGLKIGGGEIFRTRPDRSWGLPSILHNGYRVFPGGKAAGVWP